MIKWRNLDLSEAIHAEWRGGVAMQIIYVGFGQFWAEQEQI